MANKRLVAIFALNPELGFAIGFALMMVLDVVMG